MVRNKKYRFFAGFLLLLITSLVVKDFHHLSEFHPEEFHCDAFAEKHYHELHEDCDICDVTFSELNIESSDLPGYFDLLLEELDLGFNDVAILASLRQAHLRGPPFFV